MRPTIVVNSKLFRYLLRLDDTVDSTNRVNNETIGVFVNEVAWFLERIGRISTCSVEDWPRVCLSIIRRCFKFHKLRFREWK